MTQDGKVYACGEATNGRLGLGLSTGSVSVPRQLSVLSQYVIRKVAVHSGPSAFNSLTRANKIALIQPSSGSTIHTTVLRLSGFCPWQPVWAGTRRIVHPLTPILVINHLLSASSIFCNPWYCPCSTYTHDNLFAQPLCKSSGTLHFIPHTFFTQKFWWLGSFKSLAHSFCFFLFAKEITLFAFCLLFLYSFWYRHELQKEDNDWVKKCMEYEVEGARTRGKPKKTWREIVEKDCQAQKLNEEDAMDHNRWRKQIRDDWWPWQLWVGEMFLLVPAHPGCPGQSPERAVKWLCVSGTTRMSRYQKKHSLTHTYRDHQPCFISFLHQLQSSLFKLCAWQSFCTTSLQVLWHPPFHTPYIFHPKILMIRII